MKVARTAALLGVAAAGLGARRALRSDRRPAELVIGGSAREGFEPVREAFVENFTRRGELGGACCVYRDGEAVVDLWGGVRDRASGEPWRADTMVVVHSATKGLAAMVLALLHSRGLLDYDDGDPVAPAVTRRRAAPRSHRHDGGG